jgi:MoaA/NifB/PqqE/SkfB family radical SAM enzyme
MNNKHAFGITKRSVMHVTKACNADCKFCYYRFEGNHKHIPLSCILDILINYKNRYGIEYVDITGGEPTVHPQIEEIVEQSCLVGIKPTVISNAQKIDVILALIDRGLDDLLISVHGFGRNHDEAVGILGAYDRVINLFEILYSLSFNYRVNTVLTKYSCENMEYLAEAFIRYNARIVNLISFNPYGGCVWSSKENLGFQVGYHAQAVVAKKMIDILEEAGIWVNVRYMPFCFMKGYEDHICNFLQLTFDPYEWDYVSSNEMSESEIEKHTKEAVRSNRFGNTEKEKFYQHMMRHIIRDNTRVPECDFCSLNEICDLVYTQYVTEFGINGYERYGGDRIMDPMHFRRFAAIYRERK